MAKTIKFNLICDDKPIRTIEDLQNNFSIEDVLAYYNNKLLHRWLEVRGYKEELEKINAISGEKPIEIIKELIKVFRVVCDDIKVEESVYMLEFLDEREVLCAEYDKQNYKTKQIIEDYESSYRQLVDDMLAAPDDVAIIKANIAEMVENYAWILKLDHRTLFYDLKDESPLAIMCLLMNEKSRKYYLPIEVKGEDGSVTLDTDSDSDKSIMFQLICSMITTASFTAKLGKNLKTFAGATDGYWKDIETRDKKYMIIRMGVGGSYHSSGSDYVRAAGKIGGDLSKDDVECNFVIVDGIDYKSDSSTRQLMYMEV